MSQLSKLIQIQNIREIWKHEAYDFTKWLAKEENLEYLAETLGISIINPETEVSVGGFNVDIKAETDDGKIVTIENQLETTNHSHLGQIITYASGLKASYIIWVVTSAREEHREALDWLNENTTESVSFFLIEIKAYRIGNSLPAPKFEIICKPNNWQKTAQSIAKGNLSAGQKNKIEYWQSFFEFAQGEFVNRNPNKDHWLSISAGSSKYSISLLTKKQNHKGSAVEFVTGNNEIFEMLELKKEHLESELGYKLTFRRRNKYSIIYIQFKYGFDDKDKWNEIFTWYLEKIEEFRKVFPKYL